jgi:hypothetical protein
MGSLVPTSHPIAGNPVPSGKSIKGNWGPEQQLGGGLGPWGGGPRLLLNDFVIMNSCTHAGAKRQAGGH